MESRFVNRVASLAGAVMLLFAVAGCSGAPASSSPVAASSSAGSGNSIQSTEVGGNTTDELFSETVEGAEFFVFAIDGTVRTVPRCYTVDVSAGTALVDGGFYRVVADVEILNGGIAGYVDYPNIKRVASCDPVSPFDMGLPSIRDTAYGVSLIGDYADGDVLVNDQGVWAVWANGAWVHRYDNTIKLSDGKHALVRSGVAGPDVQAGAEKGVLSCADYFVLPQ